MSFAGEASRLPLSGMAQRQKHRPAADPDDLRVGSYVVPTSPPNGISEQLPVVSSGKSQIPNYQFKTKLNALSAISPPLSPKSNACNGAAQAKQHSPPIRARPLPESNSQPKAIPRSLFSLNKQNQQQQQISKSDDINVNGMIDVCGAQLEASPTSAKSSMATNISIVRRKELGVAVCNDPSDDGSIPVPNKLTPRFPRGVSRIPHQLAPANADEQNGVDPSQFQRSAADVGSEKPSAALNKYLTFNKDQATSHIKSLKEELGQTNEPVKQDPPGPQTSKPKTSISTSETPASPTLKLDPIQRESKNFETYDFDKKNSPTNEQQQKLSSSSTNFRQQPICEAFIMTGQSMLKLSNSESESTTRDKHPSNNNSIIINNNNTSSGNNNNNNNNNNHTRLRTNNRPRTCRNQNGSSRANTLPTRRLASGGNAASSTLSNSARRNLKHGIATLDDSCPNQRPEDDSSIRFRSGYLNRKRTFEAHGKPTIKGRRSWRRVHVTLEDLNLIMRPTGDKLDSEESAPNETVSQVIRTRAQTLAQNMRNSIKIFHSFAKKSTSYNKREFVFHLRLANQAEYLFQATDDADMNSWIDTLNFASACLSAPPLASAVASAASKSRLARVQRQILPSSYTKLFYWEQLIDHEERLQRLKVELDEHLSAAPETKLANKRFQTAYIERIAVLKHNIERYTVYVDLMRRRSNSPEAIVLSRHPQIASLTPSDSIIKSMPSSSPRAQ